MLEEIIKVVKELDLNDQEKIYAAEYFDGIRDRKPALFKKEQVQQECKETSLSVN